MLPNSRTGTVQWRKKKKKDLHPPSIRSRTPLTISTGPSPTRSPLAGPPATGSAAAPACATGHRSRRPHPRTLPTAGRHRPWIPLRRRALDPRTQSPGSGAPRATVDPKFPAGPSATAVAPSFPAAPTTVAAHAPPPVSMALHPVPRHRRPSSFPLPPDTAWWRFAGTSVPFSLQSLYCQG